MNQSINQSRMAGGVVVCMSATAATWSSSSKLSSMVPQYQSQLPPPCGLSTNTNTRFLTSPKLPLPRMRRRMMQVQAKKQTFSSLDELLKKSDKPVLVDFYATWCGPCQFMGPVLNEVSISMADTIQVVKIDTEKYPEIANKYNIAALPTFILFKDGKPFDRFEGALTADQLIQRIEGTLKVDI